MDSYASIAINATLCAKTLLTSKLMPLITSNVSTKSGPNIFCKYREIFNRLERKKALEKKHGQNWLTGRLEFRCQINFLCQSSMIIKAIMQVISKDRDPWLTASRY